MSSLLTWREIAAAKGYGDGWVSRCRFTADYLLTSYVLLLAARVAPPATTARFHRWRGVRMGRDVLIDRTAILDASFPEQITIEDGVRIAPGAAIIAHYAPGRVLAQLTSPHVKRVTLRRHCFIGIHAVVMPGVTVGEGAVLMAGSVATREVPDYAVALGNPARVVRYLASRAMRMREVPAANEVAPT